MLNRVMLIGNLGADVELRNMPSGGAVATISLATTMRWKDRESGEKKEATEWHRVVLFNRTAEIAEQYLKKGSKVYIEGRLRTQKWTDATGVDKYTTEIVAETMTMLDPVPQSSDRTHPSSQHQPKAKQAPGQQQNQAPQGRNQQSDYDDFNDQIPF